MNITYFSHNVDSRGDQDIKPIIRKYGMEGYGIYWAIVEDLYKNANALRTDYEGIAIDLRTQPDKVEDIVKNFGLFILSKDFFKSNGVKKRLSQIKEKSLKASKSALSRWNNNDANALQSQSESMLLNKTKLKEIKLNKTKVIKESKEVVVYGNDLSIVFSKIQTNGFEQTLSGSQNIAEVWACWLYDKKQRKKEYKTEYSEQIGFKKFLKMSGNNINIAKEIVLQSIDKGWTGLFEVNTTQELSKANKTVLAAQEGFNKYEIKV